MTPGDMLDFARALDRDDADLCMAIACLLDPEHAGTDEGRATSVYWGRALEDHLALIRRLERELHDAAYEVRP